MPSVDIEVLSPDDMCKYDIYEDPPVYKNGKCEKQQEFTPMRINVEKLKQYVVPYIDMTYDNMLVKPIQKT